VSLIVCVCLTDCDLPLSHFLLPLSPPSAIHFSLSFSLSHLFYRNCLSLVPSDPHTTLWHAYSWDRYFLSPILPSAVSPSYRTVSPLLSSLSSPLLSSPLLSALCHLSPILCTASPILPFTLSSLPSPAPVSPPKSSSSQGTREAMYLAYVDKLGVLKAQKILPDKAIGQKKEVKGIPHCNSMICCCFILMYLLYICPVLPLSLILSLFTWHYSPFPFLFFL
jgi:hypothetical protein